MKFFLILIQVCLLMLKISGIIPGKVSGRDMDDQVLESTFSMLRVYCECNCVFKVDQVK